MTFFSSKRRIAAAAVILLALFLVRPGAARLKSRIIYSISAGLGRPVDIGSVHIRVLPRPGFDLKNLVVYDDAVFGVEPMVRASEVTAALRLSSLLRGRLEIARLELTEPSLNLARDVGGHWNFEAVLERSAHIPLAPTGKAKSEPRPAFPYIEATSGRINFKNGAEKKAYALTNADFSLWQESENTWGVRLRAQPFRTDMNLNDTGLLLVSGTWQRAEAIRDTPLEVNLEWNRAQLGQCTKLITGNDKGWRGQILLDLKLKGTPAKLHVTADSSIDDFRRYDLSSGKVLHMAAHCDADYSTDTHDFRQLMCSAPSGGGMITLTGDAGFPGSHRYSLNLSADLVPAAAFLTLAQRVKKNLPEDLTGAGHLHANLSISSDGQSPPKWKGVGAVSDLRLTSRATNGEFGPETVPFVISSGAITQRQADSRVMRGGDGPRVEVGPFAISGHPGSVTLHGLVDPTRYLFSISGEADIARILRLARMAGVPVIAVNAEGLAQLDLQLAGNWINPGNGFAAPQVTGTAKLRHVHVPERNAGVEATIVSAEMQLSPDAVHLIRLSANAAGTSWTGWLELPRGCGTPRACPIQFALNTKEVAVRDMKDWVNSHPGKRPWYRVLTFDTQAHPAWWGSLRASGRLTADHLQVHGVDATLVSAHLNLEDGRLRFTGLTADVVQGKHRGEWSVDFAKAPAVCTGSGNLAGISLAAIATAMKDGWVAGTASGSYEFKGPCIGDFWHSADARFHVEVKHGMFPHIVLPDGAEQLPASDIVGEARLHDGEIVIGPTQFVTSRGSYEVSGTASLNREVNLKLAPRSSGPANAGYTIVGTLQSPRVAPLSRTEQARLKQ